MGNCPSKRHSTSVDPTPWSCNGSRCKMVDGMRRSISTRGATALSISLETASSTGATPIVTDRIALPGQPNKMVLNKAQTQLFVAQDNSDSVAVINIANNSVLTEIKITAPVDAMPIERTTRAQTPTM